MTVAVRVDLIISLDGFATTTDQTPDAPFGAYLGASRRSLCVATRTMQERVFNDASGKGTTGVDDKYARAYFENVGAEIMGAGMFGLHSFPDDPRLARLVGRRTAVPVSRLRADPTKSDPPSNWLEGPLSTSSAPKSRRFLSELLP